MELEEKLLYATSRSEIIMDVRERRGKISIELRRSGYSRFTRGEIVNTKDGLKRIAEINGGINYIMEDGSCYDYDKVEEWHPSRDELSMLYEQLSKNTLNHEKMSSKSIWFQIGRLEAAISMLEQQLESLKDLHKDITEIASHQTFKNYKHETENKG